MLVIKTETLLQPELGTAGQVTAPEWRLLSGFCGPASAQTTWPDTAMRGVMAIFAKKNGQVIIVKLESGIS